MLNRFGRIVRAIRRDERGLETLEYAVFAVAFVVIIGGVVGTLSGSLTAAYNDIGNWIMGQAADM